MRYTLPLMLCLLPLGVHAGPGKHHQMMKEKMDKMSFEDAKKMMQEKVEKKTAMMETFRSCINGAKDKAALMNCHEEKMEEKQSLKKEMKDKMKKQSEEEKPE